MIKIRLSTLSLTLAIAVITLGYVDPAFTAKPDCAHDNSHPSCSDDGGGGEPAAQYTAALTMGDFRFTRMFVTPNKRGTSYRSVSSTLTMYRNADPEGQSAWDEVFGWCNDLFFDLEISSVFVGRDNWSINSADGSEGSDIRIRFKDVDLEPTAGELQSVKVYFDLIGVVGADPFLPDGGNTSVFVLDGYVIYGDAKRGQSCRSPGNHPLVTPSKLEISRTE